MVLPDETVDRLRSQAGKLLRESAAFLELQQQIREVNAAAMGQAAAQ